MGVPPPSGCRQLGQIPNFFPKIQNVWLPIFNIVNLGFNPSPDLWPSLRLLWGISQTRFVKLLPFITLLYVSWFWLLWDAYCLGFCDCTNEVDNLQSRILQLAGWSIKHKKGRTSVSKHDNFCVFQSFKYCLSFNFETCLTYWWGRTQFSRLIEHTHVHHIKKMGLTAQKNVFWTRFDESELCWKFLHVFSEVAWYKKWLRLSVQSTNCALPDTFRQKFRHQFSNFSSLFRAAAASIIVKLIMIHHKKENLCT